MTQAQIIWSALVMAQAIIVSPYIHYLLKHRSHAVAVIPQAQPIVDELNALAVQVAALKSAADGSVSQQDVSDTIGALQTAADAVKSAAGVQGE